jgi:hypothetical protein
MLDEQDAPAEAAPAAPLPREILLLDDDRDGVRALTGLPALMVTGETTSGPVAEIRQSVVPCLFKPVPPAKLLAELQDMASRRRPDA